MIASAAHRAWDLVVYAYMGGWPVAINPFDLIGSAVASRALPEPPTVEPRFTGYWKPHRLVGFRRDPVPSRNPTSVLVGAEGGSSRPAGRKVLHSTLRGTT